MKKGVFLGLLAVILMMLTTVTIVAAEEANSKQLVPGQEQRSQADIEAAQAEVQLGANLKYYPIVPCRVLDTRWYWAGLVPAGNWYFYVADDWVPWCPIPAGPAKAVAANFAVTGATGTGNLRAWNWPAGVPDVAHMNYGNIPGLFALSNAGIFPLCDFNTDNCVDADMLVRITRATHFIMDVTGYFAP